VRGPATLLIPFLAVCASLASPERAARGEEAVAGFREVRRLPAPAARQGVAVDAAHLYAIDNHAIEKLEKRSGRMVARWEGTDGGPVSHLNSGVVVGGMLYCAHSNYPAVPMESSIEIFDAKTLSHLGRHSFGVAVGSATWVDRHDGDWWVVFANYDGRGGTPGRGPEWTTLVRFDDDWRRLTAWTFPAELVERFRGRSNSGGAWGPAGRLYATGHDAPEVYVLGLPRAGSVLELLEVVPAPIEGQGIAWAPDEPGVLYGIRKTAREIVRLSLGRGEDRRATPRSASGGREPR